MTLVAHFDLELHQMDVKTAFLNGDIDETIYMVQPESFEVDDSKQMNCKPGNTPVAKGDKFSLNQFGSLMYAQVCTRPDIAFIVGVLGRYLNNPGIDHWKAAKRVMRYLKKTKDYMLTYRRSDHLEIVGYSDSDFAGCLDSRRSTYGCVYTLAGGAISWRSAKQILVTSSTMEAEFVACFEASHQGIWLKNFVTRLRIILGVERPIKIFL
ncbi:secreted RxLR effector protein 161-like [Impatiens glandulifera]|uniref:secreted RxLR effector protein 161-like n=1 Tax=Impatiens glandulifera TaxID=253017 RepID=UPI001FB0C187|nr:secreted RxLR effector protein 161-like [Impatiens glandulifera]